MIINKFKKQNMEVVEKNQPDLAATVKAHCPELTPDQQGKVAGLIIEYVLKAGGTPYIFDDKTEEFEEEEEQVG